MVCSRAWRTLPLLLLFSVPTLVGARHSAHAPRVPLFLPMTDENGASVIGIVCDNLPDMPPAQRSRLVLALPEVLRGVPLTFTLENAQAKDNCRHLNGAGNVGSIRQEEGRLWYTPPDEFNPNPDPQQPGDVRHDSQRAVVLTVRRTNADSASETVAQQSIVLARPPVVAIHGINSSASSSSWRGGGRLFAELNKRGVETISVNHGEDKFNPRNPLLTPSLEFYGNGPIEKAAQRVAETVAQTLQTVRQTRHLAIRRVDLLGYSYGGLIARWYLHSFRADPRTHHSVRWYARSANAGATNPLYRLNPDWYAAQLTEGKRTKEKGESENAASSLPPVRKLITVASMWRGVPLCNYVNEIHAPRDSGIRLADAPFLGGHIKFFVDGSLADYLPTRVPSMEVMAVNSPWLAALNNYEEENRRKPFVDDVAYGSVAGDDNAFLGLPGSSALLDPYSVLRLAQVPSWFPYLALERHVGTDRNYSDGLVPLWSAVIVDNFDHKQPSCIVHGNHDTILFSRQTFAYVICALNNAAWLPSGRVLNPRWNSGITSRELIASQDVNSPQNSPVPDYALDPPRAAYSPDRPRRTWKFRPGDMAPPVQNALYPQIEMLGRIAPDALREIQTPHIAQITQASAVISWHTAAELNGSVTVSHWEQINFGAYDNVEVACKTEAIGPRVTRDHQFRISGLQPNTPYQVIVTSEATADPEDVISVRSDAVRFTTRY